MEAVRGTAVDEFRDTLQAGIDALRTAAVEVVLMNAQFSRDTDAIIRFEPYLRAMLCTARTLAECEPRLDLVGARHRLGHNPKVAGSNPAPATIDDEGLADAAAAGRGGRQNAASGPRSAHLRAMRQSLGAYFPVCSPSSLPRDGGFDDRAARRHHRHAEVKGGAVLRVRGRPQLPAMPLDDRTADR